MGKKKNKKKININAKHLDLNKLSVSYSQDSNSHIKKESITNYNEVSLNVLENAADNSNQPKRLSKVYHGNSVVCSDDVLGKNKANSHKSSNINDIKPVQYHFKKFIMIFIVLIFVAGSSTIVAKYLSNFESSNNYIDNSDIKIAINDIAQVDETLVKLNVFLEDTIDENKITSSKLDHEVFEKTQVKLNDLSEKFDKLSDKYKGNYEDLKIINYAKQSIEARTNMLEVGINIYDNAVDTVDNITLTQQFWDNMVNADNELKESDNLVQSQDPENFKQATVKSNEAINLLDIAKQSIIKLKNKEFKFDYDLYEKYIDLRLDSAKHIKASCEALEKEDVNVASEENLLYLERSNQASDIALKFSTTPVQALRADYYLKTSSLIESFMAARKRAAEIDFILRKFLNN